MDISESTFREKFVLPPSEKKDSCKAFKLLVKYVEISGLDAVDIACRTALAQRGVSHITIPIDIQEKKLNGNYTRHNVTEKSNANTATTIKSKM